MYHRYQFLVIKKVKFTKFKRIGGSLTLAANISPNCGSMQDQLSHSVKMFHGRHFVLSWQERQSVTNVVNNGSVPLSFRVSFAQHQDHEGSPQANAAIFLISYLLSHACGRRSVGLLHSGSFSVKTIVLFM